MFMGSINHRQTVVVYGIGFPRVTQGVAESQTISKGETQDQGVLDPNTEAVEIRKEKQKSKINDYI